MCTVELHLTLNKNSSQRAFNIVDAETSLSIFVSRPGDCILKSANGICLDNANESHQRRRSDADVLIAGLIKRGYPPPFRNGEFE